MHQGDHIIMLFSMQFLGLPASAALGGSGNENGQARAKPGRQRRKAAREAAGRPLVAQADPPSSPRVAWAKSPAAAATLAPLQGTILPRGRNARALRPRKTRG